MTSINSVAMLKIFRRYNRMRKISNLFYQNSYGVVLHQLKEFKEKKGL